MNKDQVKTLEDAIEFIKGSTTSKFVGSVNIDILLNLKDKKEVLRGSVTFPHSLGDEKKVIVFADEKEAKIALAAGADKVGLDDLLKEVLDGFTDFDVVISTSSAMPKIVRAAKILGPKGLMPNPKNGTVVQSADLEKSVKSFKAGKINFKSIQDQGTIKLKIGKLDMPTQSIAENTIELFKSIIAEAKKGGMGLFKKITISPTMGASVKVEVNDIIQRI